MEEKVTQEKLFLLFVSGLLREAITCEDVSTLQLRKLNIVLSLSLKEDLSFWMRAVLPALEICIREINNAEKEMKPKLQIQKDIKQEAVEDLVPILVAVSNNGNKTKEFNAATIQRGSDYIEELERFLDQLRYRKEEIEEIIALREKKVDEPHNARKKE